MVKPKPEPPQKTQAEKFTDLARELEADEDEERFEEQVRRIAQRKRDEPGGGNENGR